MSRKNSLQIAEWQRFGENDIGKKAFAELMDFAHGEKNAEFIGFVNSHTLKAKNFVGLIQTKSGFVLEILPKIYEKDENFDSETSQKLLFKMLKTLKNSPFKHTQMANLKAKNLPLLEIFANMFLDELDTIIKSGLKNNYVAISQNRHFLKGKLLFNEHLKRNLIHKERFYTNSDEFIANIPENRIIVSALNLLWGLSFGFKTRARLTNAKFIFAGISESKNPSADFAKCQSSRHFSRYNLALAWCKIFLKNESFTQYSGSDRAFALLFDMNLLFESFVADYFKKHSDFEIKTQSSSKYLLADDGGENLFKMRPDILAIKGKNTIILDTKWKIIKSIKDDISQSDLYQMFAYAKKFKSRDCVLIYPKIGQTSEKILNYKADNTNLKIAFFDLFDENLINLQITNILGKTMTDEFYMNLALQEAWRYQILTFPNPAVGCVVADTHGKILSINSHKKAGLLHAEANAVFVALCEISDKFLSDFLKIYEAKFGVDFMQILKDNENFIYGDFFDKNLKNLGENSRIANKILEFKNLNANFVYEFILQNHANLLKNGAAFVTLEPCSHIGKTPSCANLLKELKFARVIIGSADLNPKASGGGEILTQNGIEVKFGVLKNECDELLKPFIAWQKSGNFSFFKLAFSANGVITGEISNLKSHTFSHYLRSVCDSLMIGGNTVRTDRPRLDTRLICGGKNPNIFIYSKRKEFDKTIPLFGIAGRSVKITNDLQEPLNSGLMMIEGGENLLNLVADKVDLFLFFRSNSLKMGENFKSELKFKPLFTAKFDNDEFGWYELEK